MALGKRTAKQIELFVPLAQLPKSPAHPFYSKLNGLLAECAFDPFVEKLCEPYYKEGGRPSIPPRRLNRWRSEKCERSFAHVCETGGGRRMWLRGLENASKSHLLRCASYNLGLVLRKCYGLSKPRSAAGAAGVFFILGLFVAIGFTGSDSPFPPGRWTLWGAAAGERTQIKINKTHADTATSAIATRRGFTVRTIRTTRTPDTPKTPRRTQSTAELKYSWRGYCPSCLRAR